MENYANLDMLKVPAPNFDNANGETVVPKRKYNMPKVGVVDVPKISSHPLKDTLDLNKKENPKMAYKLSSSYEKKTKGLRLDMMVTASIIGLSLVALYKQTKTFSFKCLKTLFKLKS